MPSFISSSTDVSRFLDSVFSPSSTISVDLQIGSITTLSSTISSVSTLSQSLEVNRTLDSVLSSLSVASVNLQTSGITTLSSTISCSSSISVDIAVIHVGGLVDFVCSIDVISRFKISTNRPWPIELPQSPLLSGYSDGLAENVIRSQLASWIPGNYRSRSSAGAAPIVFPLMLTHSQKLALDHFYNADLVGGTRVFTLKLPGETLSSRMRFTSPPSYRAVSHNHWSITLQLEIVP